MARVDQALLGAVVQVALDAPAFGVAGRDDAFPRAFDLGEAPPRLAVQVLVLQGDRRRRGDRVDQFGVVVNRPVVDIVRSRRSQSVPSTPPRGETRCR
jgi:hypothetical protein